MKKKQLLALALSSAMLLSACSNSQAETQTDASGKISIVATSFHEYDWVTQIVGDNADNFDITWLMDTGVDLHSYEPSVEDVITISNADLFIYNGGPSQSWVPEVVEAAVNENQVVINVMDSLGDAVKLEVAVEGMQASTHDHSHDEEHAHDEDEHTHDEDEHTHDEDEHTHDEDEHTHDEDEHTHDEDEHTHDEDEHTEHVAHDDEHVWLSLDNAVTVCQVIEAEISKLDSENSAVYKENSDNYIASLNALDEEYHQYLSDTVYETVIFADRFPFLYMMNEYDVDYYAAFQGCSAETEASFETITFLAEKLDGNESNAIFIIDDGLEELAQTVIENSEDKVGEIFVLDSMQSVSLEDMQEGISYYAIMEQNLITLKTVLQSNVSAVN